MRPEKLLLRIQAGHIDNIRFADLVRLVRALGFVAIRTTGSHRMFLHREFGIRLNLQRRADQATGYQVRQIRDLIDEYNLDVET